MSRDIPLALPIVSALLIVAAASVPAAAQTVPTPGTQQQAGVREILNRAETESRRRSAGEILGGIAGVSQAAAQTTPPAAPRETLPARRPAAVATGAGQSAPTAGARPAQIAQAAGPAQPATRPPTAARRTASEGGTPSNPSMIATAPDRGASSSEPPAPQQAPAPDTRDAPPAVDASTASDPAVVGADAPRTTASETGRRLAQVGFRRAAGYGYEPGWCPPQRW